MGDCMKGTIFFYLKMMTSYTASMQNILNLCSHLWCLHYLPLNVEKKRKIPLTLTVRQKKRPSQFPRFCFLCRYTPSGANGLNHFYRFRGVIFHVNSSIFNRWPQQLGSVLLTLRQFTFVVTSFQFTNIELAHSLLACVRTNNDYNNDSHHS